MTHPNQRFNNDIRMQSPDILKSSYIEVIVFFNNLLLCCATEICNLSSQPALKVCSTFFQGFDDENIRQWHILKTKFRWDVLWASPMIEKHFLSEIFNNKSQMTRIKIFKLLSELFNKSQMTRHVKLCSIFRQYLRITITRTVKLKPYENLNS